MSVSLSQLAQLVGGQIRGEKDPQITGAATIRNAAPGEITLADDASYVQSLKSSQATAVVVPVDSDMELGEFPAIARRGCTSRVCKNCRSLSPDSFQSKHRHPPGGSCQRISHHWP